MIDDVVLTCNEMIREGAAFLKSLECGRMMLLCLLEVVVVDAIDVGQREINMRRARGGR